MDTTNSFFDHYVLPELTKMWDKYLEKRISDDTYIYDIYWHLNRDLEVKIMGDDKMYSSLHYPTFEILDTELGKLVDTYANGQME